MSAGTNNQQMTLEELKIFAKKVIEDRKNLSICEFRDEYLYVKDMILIGEEKVKIHNKLKHIVVSAENLVNNKAELYGYIVSNYIEFMKKEGALCEDEAREELEWAMKNKRNVVEIMQKYLTTPSFENSTPQNQEQQSDQSNNLEDEPDAYIAVAF